MNISINPHNTNFRARCIQVRDADWVCRTISHKLPHFSSTKIQPAIEKYLQKNAREINYDGTQKTLSEIYSFLDDIVFKEGNQKLIDTIYSIKKMITDFGKKRLAVNELVANNTKNDMLYETLLLMTKYKSGNCTENAIMAEFICKLNGIKNACSAIVNKNNHNSSGSSLEPLDHLVCVVNLDGTKFDGKINRNTIIIDPWLNKADFANNIELFFRKDCSNFFDIKPEEKFVYQVRELINLTDEELEEMKIMLPDLIFKNKTHIFLQKKEKIKQK